MSTTKSEQVKNATIYQLIDTMTSVNPSGVQKVLQDNGFVFQYGLNPSLQEKYLLQLYHNNAPLFWNISGKVSIDRSKVQPDIREKIDVLVSKSPVKKMATGGTTTSWWQTALNLVQGTPTTSGGGQQTTTETSTGAYIAYVGIAVAIVVLVIYLFRTIK